MSEASFVSLRDLLVYHECRSLFRVLHGVVCMAPQKSKVFGIGMHRTGTASLRRAFNLLGFRCLEDFGCWFITDLDRSGHLVFRPTEAVHAYDAYADNPIPLFVKELDAMFPGSRFILTFRDVDDWLDSVEYIFRVWREDWMASPDHRFIAACHEALYGSTHFDRQRGREVYLRHNESVREYFARRPADLLQIDMTEGCEWGSICNFLDVPVPDRPYPILNARET